jgi:Ca2+-binding RTX toxin-like protein
MHARIIALAVLLATPLVVSPTAVHAAASCHGRAVTIEAQPGSATIGTPGDDVILVGAGTQERVDAGAGDDLVCVAADAAVPTVVGGAGADTIVLAVAVDIEVKLGRSAQWGDTEVGLSGLENAVVSGRRTNVYGTRGDNVLVARSTDGALLTGKEGDDVLRLGLVPGVTNHDGLRLASGGPGNDVLRGSPVRDVLTGGPGRDKAVGHGGKDVCTAEVRKSCELS